jgi:hypothetical protein
MTDESLAAHGKARCAVSFTQGLRFRVRDLARLLGLVTLLTTALALPHAAQAQVLPSSEMNASGASTAATPPTQGPTSATLFNNPDNPGANTFAAIAAPAPAVTVQVLNQQYANNSNFASNGLMIGGTFAGDPLYGPLNFFGGAQSGQFTSLPSVAAGTGIDASLNHAFVFEARTNGLRVSGAPNSGRIQFADIRLDFSAPISNPVLHIAGLGGIAGGKNFTIEFDFIAASSIGATGIAPLSGNAAFVVSGSQINNGVANANASCAVANQAACGSVHVLGDAVTSVYLRTYMRSNQGTIAWPTTGAEGFFIGVSGEVSDMQPTFGPLPAELIPGETYNGLTLTCTNAGPNTARGAFCEPSVDVGTISNLSCTPAAPASISAISPDNTTVCTFDYTIPASATEDEVIFTGQTGAINDRIGGAEGTAGNNQVTQARPVLRFTLDKSSPTLNYAAAGDVISYEFLITNTGGATLPFPPAITDPLIASITCPSGSIPPGGTRICTGSYTATQADLDAGQVENTANASITIDGRTATVGPSTATVPAVQIPR